MEGGKCKSILSRADCEARDWRKIKSAVFCSSIFRCAVSILTLCCQCREAMYTYTVMAILMHCLLKSVVDFSTNAGKFMRWYVFVCNVYNNSFG